MVAGQDRELVAPHEADLAPSKASANGRLQPETAASPEVRLIADDALFDDAFYVGVSGAAGDRTDLVSHYLAVGEPAGLSPSLGFDARFYRDANPDVAAGGASPLMHYLLHGRAEWRYPNLMRLRLDGDRLSASGLFDAAAYAWDRGGPALPGLSDAEDYLARRRQHAPIGKEFDSTFYLRAYDDAQDRHAFPILHYMDIGRSEHRVANDDQLFRRMEIERPRFNARYYLGQFHARFPELSAPISPLQHSILVGSRIGLDPAPDFSADYYLRRYPDLRSAGMAPFYHFVAFGRAEGRLGRPDFTARLTRGGRLFDNAKPTILVASHEASRTGAPLVGLNVGRWLAQTHNVISFLGKPGPLLPDFTEQSCLVAAGPLSPLDAEFLLLQLRTTHLLSAVLMNSVETDAFAEAALQAGLPSVALLHEFAEYTLPTGRMSNVVEFADRVITPAALIHDSAQSELLATRSGRASTIMVRPQGYLPVLPQTGSDGDLTRTEILGLIGDRAGTPLKIVLGAGYVQMRKGVDLFVQTAAEARRLWGDDIRFIWVGDGYDPQRDVQFSTWVADMVRRLDLEQHVIFLPAQGSLATLFDLSDVFYLPSRLDPFPNVALDAFKAGRAVVCFENATGFASLLHDAPGQDAAVGVAVAYCNVLHAAEAIIHLFEPAEVERALGNTALIERRFGFADYMAFIAEQMEAAAVDRAAAMRVTDAIVASGLFDPAFHDNVPGPVDPARHHAAVRAYVARGQKGLICNNPRPGFNEGLARSRLARPGPALDPHGPSATHRCVLLTGEAASIPSGPAGKPALNTALHLHIHYPELATEFMDRLTAARAQADLIVTTTSDARRLEIEYTLRGYKGGAMRFIVVPNRGRDIGPFITEVGRLIRDGQYDIVGHLHGKRSLAVDAVLGDRWRSYLLGTLLGGEAGLTAVQALFAAEPNLGLVFAEDRHCVGWSKNRSYADALASRTAPPLKVPDWPVFPIGTMFWARPAAMQPLWSLNLGLDDFPTEPAPYDGTVLHAIERLLPTICEASGHDWCTLYRTGHGW